MARITGTVKWFNDAKGFGFISREGGPTSLYTSAQSPAPASSLSLRVIESSSRLSRDRKVRRRLTSRRSPSARFAPLSGPGLSGAFFFFARSQN